MEKELGKEIEKEIEEKIEEWQFAECPVEIKYPFLWRWTEYGLKQLSVYIKDLLEQQKNKI